MKRVSIVICLATLAMSLLSTTVSAARPMPPGLPEDIEVTFLTPLPTELAVGETYTIRILLESTSGTPFLQAIAMTNAYYPGRGVFFSGGDRVVNDTSAELKLVITGKNSTAVLPSVCDWPAPGDPCTDDGTAPLAIALGVRYKGGEVYGGYTTFAVTVP